MRTKHFVHYFVQALDHHKKNDMKYFRVISWSGVLVLAASRDKHSSAYHSLISLHKVERIF